MDELTEKNILFFDGTCGFCHKSVQIFYKNQGKTIYFAPLQGQSAAALQMPESARNANSLVLFSNQKFYTNGQALRKLYTFTKPKTMLRMLLGLTHVLPLLLVNATYRIIANNRHQLHSAKACTFDSQITPFLLP
ncbi:MAG: thiol-disulfide oxidoreductase DCC family protein [Bacteroidota bacterium]